MPVTGQDLVIKNLRNFGGGFLKHVNKTMDKARARLDHEVTQNMNLRDHSLAYQAKMGHPYASRWGSQGMAIHDPFWLVHTHSGALLGSKESKVVEAVISGGRLVASAYVRLDERQAKHAVYLIWGTSKMIPRDFLHGSLAKAKDDLFAIIKRGLKDAVVEFQGEETKL